MAEYIDRRKAIEQIKAEWAKLPLAETTGFGILMRVLTSIPAADVRPIVLCKDCMHWEYDAIFADGWCRGRQQGNPNWFCADGERREES